MAGKGPGWVRTAGPAPADSCFAHYALREEERVEGVKGLVDYFLRTSVGEVYDKPWPLVLEGASRSLEARFLEQAKKRMARVVKLALPRRPERGGHRGLFAYAAGEELWASRTAIFGGQRRMADDPRAPSRSYLKVEEAYAVLGAAPGPGERVADLGAAPGGWSYSAAKRGADVLAVDNGPLKGGAAEHPGIEHRAEDAFKFQPAGVDWLFCDMVEDPARVLELLERWLARGWCRSFIVNLKFGRLDPLPLLRRARALEPRCSALLARHLYHDREELTLVGRVR